MTPELSAYQAGMAGVTNYVNRTFSLFSTAQQLGGGLPPPVAITYQGAVDEDQFHPTTVGRSRGSCSPIPLMAARSSTRDYRHPGSRSTVTE